MPPRVMPPPTPTTISWDDYTVLGTLLDRARYHREALHRLEHLVSGLTPGALGAAGCEGRRPTRDQAVVLGAVYDGTRTAAELLAELGITVEADRRLDDGLFLPRRRGR